MYVAPVMTTHWCVEDKPAITTASFPSKHGVFHLSYFDDISAAAPEI
jgi:hypothetical protein